MSATITDVLPLAPVQEGLLFHAVHDTGEADPYLVQARFEIRPGVTPQQVRAAVDALLERHPNLRACFRYQGLDRPVQVIPRLARVPWTELRLPEGALPRLLAEDRARGFDVARPPLVRAMLVRHGEAAELILTFHHILLDGWSVPVLQRDLTALAEGRPLPPVVPYRSYAAWLSRQDPELSRLAWEAALDGLEPPVPLAPEASDAGPDRTEYLLPAELTARLSRRAAEAGVTVNTLVQTAWGLVLARTTGSRDVVFGGVVAGRPHDLPGVEDMVGLFINTLPVRIRLRDGERTGELLARVQDEQARLVGHHHVRLAELQRAAGPGGLFDSVLAFENFPRRSAADAVPAIGLVEVADATHYPVTLAVAGGERMLLRVGCRRGLSANRVAARLAHALAALAGDPARPVDELGVLPLGERPAVAPARAVPLAVLPPRAPRTEREQLLCALFGEVLGGPALAPDTDFFAQGGHSLTAMRLTARIEKALRTRVPLDALFAARTPAALDAWLDKAAASKGESMDRSGLAPLLTLRTGGDRTPVFCLHPGLGFGWGFTALLPHLDPERPVHVLQTPALQQGVPRLPADLGELADEYTARIRAERPHGPYLLVGRSFGGPLAHEIAVRLRRAGEEIGLLAIIDALPLPPELARRPLDPDVVEQEVLRLLLANLAPDLPAPPAPRSRAEVFRLVRSGTRLPTGPDDRWLTAVADTAAHGMALARSWVPSPYDGTVTLFSATAGPSVIPTSVKAAAWRRAAPAVDVHELDCAHGGVLDPEPAARIAAVLEHLLQPVQSSKGE